MIVVPGTGVTTPPNVEPGQVLQEPGQPVLTHPSGVGDVDCCVVVGREV